MARIIIADDDKLTVDLVISALEMGGHIVGALYDGAQVVDITSKKRPDLLILDCSMPVKSGVEALKDVRLSPICYNTPVLMLTALKYVGDEDRAMRAGANYYLTKPFDPDQLLVIVDSILHKFAKFH